MSPAATQPGALIVGASQAGLQLAVSLRDHGYTQPVTLVGAEQHPPYQRPPLSKKVLAGTADAESLALRTPAFYADRDISLIRADRVEAIALDAAGVGEAKTASGRVLGFDRLALTVGARPRRLDVPGAELDGVCYLRDLDDATHLGRRLPDARRIVVVGGGFIGLEAAAVARALGKTVTVVETLGRLVARAVAPVMSEFHRAAHERRGTLVRLGVGVSALHGEDGRVTGVELTDGSVLPADLVLVGIGVVPRTELAQQLGLACDRGIVVDSCARTSHPHIVAAGDCTVLPHPLTGTGLVRLESVQNAVDQAKTAAAALAGAPTPYTTVPWFWSDQDTLKLQIAGLSAGYDAHVVRGEPDSEKFSVLYYRKGRLIAADCVNRAPDYMAVRRALGQGLTIPGELAADIAVPLKNLMPPSR